MARPIILHEGPATKKWNFPVAEATSLEKGDFISMESAYCVLMDLVSEDATFLGIANGNIVASTGGAADETAGVIEVLLECIIECDSTSATYTPGQDVKYAGENAVVDAGSNDTIMWSLESKATATRLICLVDVVALQKLFAVAATSG